MPRPWSTASALHSAWWVSPHRPQGTHMRNLEPSVSMSMSDSPQGHSMWAAAAAREKALRRAITALPHLGQI